MQLRSGNTTQVVPIKTKSFNVRSRADTPSPSNVVISSDASVVARARENHLEVLTPAAHQQPPLLRYAYDWEQLLDQRGTGKYLLKEYAATFLYFTKGPLDLRAPHPNPARAASFPSFPDPPDADEIRITVPYTGPVTQGLTTPLRNAVMGGSALNYARWYFEDDWADQRRWEWLHIQGHALGGDNEEGNLVAGTFDANTQMIPIEARIRELSQAATPLTPLIVEWWVHLYPRSWVAIDIGMKYSGRLGQCDWSWARATSGMAFDRFQYDVLSGS